MLPSPGGLGGAEHPCPSTQVSICLDGAPVDRGPGRDSAVLAAAPALAPNQPAPRTSQTGRRCLRTADGVLTWTPFSNNC